MTEKSTRGEALDTPVVFIVFNRPHLTEASLDAIRTARPRKLFIVADGPREGFADDVERCAAVRRVADGIDWPCEVQRDYAEVNLGLKQRVETGLDWVFGEVDRAIVLEDDCIAGTDFFSFCDDLLERYADDDRVMAVTGNNFQDGIRRGDCSYYFSKYPHCWGWATWARAWANYDGGYTDWTSPNRAEAWGVVHPDRIERRYWSQQFAAGRARRVDSWAYPWTDTVWRCRGLTATPEVNLVRNVGFGPDATHTNGSDLRSEMEVGTLPLPLRHPVNVAANIEADRVTFDSHFGGAAIRSRRTPVGATRWVASGLLKRFRRYVGK